MLAWKFLLKPLEATAEHRWVPPTSHLPAVPWMELCILSGKSCGEVVATVSPAERQKPSGDTGNVLNFHSEIKHDWSFALGIRCISYFYCCQYQICDTSNLRACLAHSMRGSGLSRQQGPEAAGLREMSADGWLTFPSPWQGPAHS